ncbi:Uncharacterised protein r2_g1842 [Pycnogonum litorale]
MTSIALLLLFSSAFHPSYGMISMTSVVGRSASLPCNISSPIINDSMTLVLWYKGVSEVPLYSLDARSGLDVFSPEHFVADPLREKITFRIKSNPPLLVINNIKDEDGGIYTCRVDFRQARSISHFVKLSVIIPPERPKITDEFGTTLHGRIGPFNEGDSLRLPCSVKKGRPTPSLIWLMYDRPIDQKYTVTKERLVKNELVLHKLDRSYVDARLTCQASNNNITKPSTSHILLNLNLKPLKVRIISKSTWMSAGKSIKFECKSVGSRPPAEITWWKGTHKLTNVENLPTKYRNVSRNVVTFVPSHKDNGKFLACRTENPNIAGSALEDGWILKVHYKPRLHLKIGRNLKIEQIKEGQDVYFECISVANPQVAKYKWYFEGKPLVQNKEERILIQDNTLVLQRVKRHRKGRYKCSARNKEGLGFSNVFTLSVKHAPACVDAVQHTYYVSYYEEARVLCQVDANPPQVSFTWRFNNNRDRFEIINFESNGMQSIGKYTPGNEKEYGTLLCTATNSIGRQQIPCAFNIQFAGPPEPVSNCSLTNRTVNTLSVICDPGFDGGLPQIFIMEVFDSRETILHANVTSRTYPEFFAQNLPPNTRLKILIYSRNDKGRSHSIPVNTETLALPSRSDPEDMFMINPLLGILVGIVLTLVFMAFIVILVMKFRNRQKNIQILLTTINAKENERGHNEATVACYNEVNAKNPDVIPPKSSFPDSGYSECNEEQSLMMKGRMVQGVVGGGNSPPPYLNEYCKPTLILANNSENPRCDEVAYAELSLPKNDNPIPRTVKPQTQYASIDFVKTHVPSKMSRDKLSSPTLETPLIENGRESQV